MQDFRILKELPVLYQMISRFKEDILEIQCTNDVASSSPGLIYKKQENPDWIFKIKSKVNSETLNKVLGVNLSYKHVAFDEKAGQNMFKHSSSGNVGLLT